MIRRIFTRALWICVDRFGLLLCCNLLTLLLTMPVITLPLGLAGLLHVAEKLVSTRKASMEDYFAGMKKLGGRMYIGVSSLVFLGLCCHWAWRFYSMQPPFVKSMGCTIALLTAATGLSLGYVMLHAIARRARWKECLAESARIILEKPTDVLKLLIAVFAVECILTLTGAGLIAFGWTWPLLASLLFRAEPQYQEDRTIKDFFAPTNLIK